MCRAQLISPEDEPLNLKEHWQTYILSPQHVCVVMNSAASSGRYQGTPPSLPQQHCAFVAPSRHMSIRKDQRAAASGPWNGKQTHLSYWWWDSVMNSDRTELTRSSVGYVRWDIVEYQLTYGYSAGKVSVIQKGKVHFSGHLVLTEAGGSELWVPVRLTFTEHPAALAFYLLLNTRLLLVRPDFKGHFRRHTTLCSFTSRFCSFWHVGRYLAFVVRRGFSMEAHFCQGQKKQRKG